MQMAAQVEKEEIKEELEQEREDTKQEKINEVTGRRMFVRTRKDQQRGNEKFIDKD